VVCRGDHDRIDLLPEKKRYEPGETAIFQVRMPFREATALVYGGAGRSHGNVGPKNLREKTGD